MFGFTLAAVAAVMAVAPVAAVAASTAADSVGLERLRRRRRWQLSISMTTDTMTVGRSVSLRCNTLGHDTEGHDSSFISSGSLYHDALVNV